MYMYVCMYVCMYKAFKTTAFMTMLKGLKGSVIY